MQENTTIKNELLKFSRDYVQDRVDRFQREINQVQEAANEETKSSMGDKYETSRAMAQMEVERNTNQLAEARKLEALLNTISIAASSDKISMGSLVTTDNGVYFLAISIGEVTIRKRSYFIIAADSPVGKLLMGKHTGDEVKWKEKTIAITNVV